MEDELKRLLDAELRAEALVEEANRERDRLIHQAREDARAAEQRFETRIPELRNVFLGKAEERAVKAVAEMTRRYEERREHLRAMARDHEREAIASAIALLIDPDWE
ncbi:MAG: ATPase [Acidiferrobacterales bacterium]